MISMKNLLFSWRKLHKITKTVFLTGLIFSFILTLFALFLSFSDNPLHQRGSVEVVFASSDILYITAIVSLFLEIYIKRFFNR